MQIRHGTRPPKESNAPRMQRTRSIDSSPKNNGSELEAELAVAGLDLDLAAGDGVEEAVDDEVAAHPGGDLPQLEAPEIGRAHV